MARIEEADLPGDPIPLPSYERPPVTEVVMAAYFAPIMGLHVGHLGLYWELLRDSLPQVQQQPALPPQEPENFGPASVGSGFRVELVAAPALPRTWFVSDDGALVVQIQHDRFVLNWRRVDDATEYPRYPAIRERFESYLGGFLAFLVSQQLDPPSRLAGEVAYVNTIRTGGVWNAHAEADKIFTQWVDASLPNVDAEDLRFAQRFTFPNADGEATGRLYIEADPVFIAQSGEPAFNLVLTARGGPSSDLEDVLDFADTARERIVTCFHAMTTEEMHREWGEIHE